MVRQPPPDDHRFGYQPENHEWQDWLCEPYTAEEERFGRLRGRDPMTIPLDVLSAAGHPRSTAANVKYRLRIMQGQHVGEMRDDPLPFPEPRKLKGDVRRYCLGCSGDDNVSVRICPIYDCPAWPYRMGRNPHNPRRGIAPPHKIGASPKKPPV